MIRPIAYETHPVSPARKAELIGQGFRILDAAFKPAEVAAAEAADAKARAEAEERAAAEAQAAAAAAAPVEPEATPQVEASKPPKGKAGAKQEP